MLFANFETKWEEERGKLKDSEATENLLKLISFAVVNELFSLSKKLHDLFKIYGFKFVAGYIYSKKEQAPHGFHIKMASAVTQS